jgi:hypothetical protein
MKRVVCVLVALANFPLGRSRVDALGAIPVILCSQIETALALIRFSIAQRFLFYGRSLP